MMPSEYGSTAPTSPKSPRSEIRDDDPPLLVERRAVERPREQLHLRELHRLVDALEDALQVGPGLEQVGREPQRLRCRVRVLEPARVGDEPRVERLGDRRRQRDAELGEHVGQHLRRRRCLGGDEVRGAEAGVVVMVVDVDDDRCLEQALVGEPRLLRAVDRHENPVGRVGGQLAQQPATGEVEKSVLRRAAAPSPASNHHAVLAELRQREVHREQRAERVSVRVLVRGDEEAVVRRAAPRRRRPCQSSASSLVSSGPGSRSSISFVIRTPCSTD